MSRVKRLIDENPHGICQAYIESQDTALNTAKDQIVQLIDALGNTLNLIEAYGRSYTKLGRATDNAEKAAEIWLTGTAALTKAEEFIGKEKGDSE